MMPSVTIHVGDWIEQLRLLPDASVQCVVTSPPYFGLRDYGIVGQLGMESDIESYVGKLVRGFAEVRRVLRGDGTLWLNLGDSYAGYWGGKYAHKPFGKDRTPDSSTPPHKQSPDFKTAGFKPKDLIGIPWRVAFALQADGWWLRQDIIWHKPNPMPESVTDRCTKAHEYIFLLTKSARYFYDAEAIKEPCSESTHMRISQDLAKQVGSFRANGGNKTNGPMKALIAGSTRKLAEAGSGIANNRSYEAALSMPVESRNKRSVWTVPSTAYSEAHFATFPPDLIKPCILAGTSPVGCCPECGAPWERVTEKTEDVQATAKGSRFDKGKTGVNGNGRVQEGERFVDVTTGWQPTCQHGEDASEVRSPVPCTVLDPFFGSGTTGQVSLELGRNCIGIELNPEYVKLAERRCHVTPGLQLA